jgi:hypothetical protein
LEAETEYSVIIYLKDRGKNLMEIPSVLNYKTSDRYNSGLMKINFKQKYLNSAEKSLIFEKIAFLMSLEKNKI